MALKNPLFSGPMTLVIGTKASVDPFFTRECRGSWEAWNQRSLLACYRTQS